MIKRFLTLLMIITCVTAYQGMANSGGDTSVTAGAHLYVQCTGCHSPSYHRTGPMHCGLLGRKAGNVEDFTFTQSMKNSGVIWTEATLEQFLQSPLEMLPGTSMGFSGIDSPIERQQLISFLASLTATNPLCR